MDPNVPIEAIAEIIQLAVAPVFLLTGIAGFLSVLSNRLGRITDRARVLERRIPASPSEDHRAVLQEETTQLWNRIRMINWAIRLCVGSAMLVCLVIVTLFVADITRFNISLLIAAFFVGAMLLIFSGLLLLLREVGIATKRMRLGLEPRLGSDS